MKRTVLIVALLWPLTGLPHEGHQHAADAEPLAAAPVDAPQRLADGRLQVAKASQHLWQLRTQVTRESEVSASVELSGRVVADPSAGGRVQAPFDGIVEADPRGLPLPGQAVKAGEVLAWLRPSVAPMERSARLAEQADVAARLAVARQRAARLATAASA